MNTQQRAAMQMALRALIKANPFHDYEDEITALREALAQPQESEKKWVGLTDEEYDLCCQGNQPLNIRVRMVAMALKNKNTGA